MHWRKNLNKDLVADKTEEKQEDIDAKRADVLSALNDAIKKSQEKEQKEKLTDAKKAAMEGNLQKAKTPDCRCNQRQQRSSRTGQRFSESPGL